MTTDKPLCVAVVGGPKQGRYLLWRLLYLLLPEYGHSRSHMRESGLWKEVASDKFHFPESLDINSVDFQNEVRDDPKTRKLCCWWPDPEIGHRFDIDIRNVVEGSSLISGTVHLSEMNDPRCEAVTHTVFVIRDGRDQLVSFAHYMMDEDVRKRWAAARNFSTARDAFRGYFGYVASLWKRNAIEWLEARSRPDVLCITFEELTQHKPETLRGICEFLGLPARDDVIEMLCEKTSVEASRKHIPDHVRNARSGDWRGFFSAEELQAYYSVTGDLLYRCGYDPEPPKGVGLGPDGKPPFSDYDPGRDYVIHMHRVVKPVPARKTFVFQPKEPMPEGAEELAMIGSITGKVFSDAGPQPAYVVFPKPDAPEEETIALASKADDVLRSKYLQSKTVERFGKVWAIHALRNITTIAGRRMISDVDDTLKGRPAILISPGPSLSKQLPKLREAVGKAAIICGTHSLHALRSVGITPDIVLIADPGKHERHFEGIPADGLKVAFFAATVRPEEMKIPARRKVIFCGNGASDAWMFESTGEDWNLSTGGSVACSALSLALRLGCEPIVLIGQDLSIGEGRYYAAEALDGDSTVEREPSGAFKVHRDGELIMNLQNAVPIPGYHGGEVFATQSLHAFWAWFETICEREKGKRTIINATEGGAAIRPAIRRPFAEVVAEFGDRFSVEEALGVPFDTVKRRGMLRAKVKEMSRASVRTIHEADRCLASLRKLLGEKDPEKRRAGLEELRDREVKLKEQVDRFRIFSLYNHSEIVTQDEAARTAPDLSARIQCAFRSFCFVRRAADFFSGPLAEAAAALDRM